MIFDLRETAVNWDTPSFPTGNIDALGGLFVRYLYGEGILQDFKAAYFWALIAKNSGHSVASDLSLEISKSLSPEVRKVVEGQVKIWKPKIARKIS